jgi:hypothetical protein
MAARMARHGNCVIFVPRENVVGDDPTTRVASRLLVVEFDLRERNGDEDKQRQTQSASLLGMMEKQQEEPRAHAGQRERERESAYRFEQQSKKLEEDDAGDQVVDTEDPLTEEHEHEHEHIHFSESSVHLNACKKRGREKERLTPDHA